MYRIKKITYYIFFLSILILSGCSFSTEEEFQDKAEFIADCRIQFFTQAIRVFDSVLLCGTDQVPTEKMDYIAAVTAQWLDNDQDGIADNPKINQQLKQAQATMVISADGFSNSIFRKLLAVDLNSVQDLYASETDVPSRRDASPEEVHHLIMNYGWIKQFPEVFSAEKKINSELYQAFRTADENEYYAYNAPDCDTDCKITEYIYKVTAAFLGSNVDLAETELRLKTLEQLREKNPQVVTILESKDYDYPKYIWPDGKYKFKQNIKHLTPVSSTN